MTKERETTVETTNGKRTKCAVDENPFLERERERERERDKEREARIYISLSVLHHHSHFLVCVSKLKMIMFAEETETRNVVSLGEESAQRNPRCTFVEEG
jgi:hypothetical protein